MKWVMILSGLTVLALAWFGPMPELAKASFTAHMAMHVSVVAIAAPLLAAGLVLTTFFDRRIPSVLLAPVPASLFEFIVVWAWHVPALHHLARQSTAVFVAEQASFLFAGLLLWTSSLRPSTATGDSRGAGVIALLLTSMHMVLLGTLLTLSTRPLYHEATLRTAYDVLADQQVGGILMLAGAGLPYLAGGLWLVWSLLQVPGAEAADLLAESRRGGK
ncbi:MAG: cytochrome c oxidase assembly protein [Woeseia sp.]